MGKEHVHFNVCLGNPPYQEETEADSTRMPPVYNLFMDEAYKVSDKIELITPARFLFNAGWTPKEWNEKMLSDPHFKVLHYFQKSEDVFPQASIMGGIVITYHDQDKNFGPISIFTAFPELNSILKKVSEFSEDTLSGMAFPALSYKVSEKMVRENPNLPDRLRTNAFKVLADIFFDSKPEDGVSYARLLGLDGRSRVYRYIREDYLKVPENYSYFKVIIPESNGSGALGEKGPTVLIGNPVIGNPGDGHTQTFMSIGQFKTKSEADNALKYIKSKFARVLLGVKKATQHNPPEKWCHIPVQDFSGTSHIDWTKSISDIDRQLYKKYNLSPEEIEFIETHVKEME